jgi:hypothetical protein
VADRRPGGQLGVRHKDRTNVVWTSCGVGYVRITSKHGVFTAIFDADRWSDVEPRSWNVSKRGSAQTSLYDHVTKERRSCSMHQYLFPDCPEGKVRDHINRNKLDNRASNIRFVSPSNNNFNRSRRYRPGVSFLKRAKKYQAQLVVGIYDTEVEAHEAWLEAWLKVRGEKPEFVNV